MRLGLGGSINNLYPESFFWEIATFFVHIVTSSKGLKERTMQKCKMIYNSFFEGESNAQLSLVRSI